jgi:hypothetical protein
MQQAPPLFQTSESYLRMMQDVHASQTEQFFRLRDSRIQLHQMADMPSSSFESAAHNLIFSGRMMETGSANPAPVPTPNDGTGCKGGAMGCPSPLHQEFFSRPNVYYVHQQLKHRVKEQTGITIGDQDETALRIRMRSAYILHATHVPFHIQSLSSQVNELNEKVLQDAVVNVIGNIQDKQFLLERQAQGPIIPPTPLYMGKAGTRGTKNIGVIAMY